MSENSEVNNDGTEQKTEETNDTVKTDDVEALKLEVAQLRAEAAKQRKLKQQAIKDRDANKQDNADDYKKLWETTKGEHEKLLAKVKQADVASNVTARLTKVGVIPDALDAAVKLVDRDLIEWDPDSGVDGTSVDAAVAKLKSEYKFLFEQKVPKSTPKAPADGGTSDTSGKTISRVDFEKLGSDDRMERVRKGFKIID